MTIDLADDVVETHVSTDARPPVVGEQMRVTWGLPNGPRVYTIDEIIGRWNHGWLVIANRRRRYFVTLGTAARDGVVTWTGWSFI